MTGPSASARSRAAALLVVVALAACAARGDVISISTRPDGTGVSHAAMGDDPVAVIEAHLILSGCSQESGIAGFECRLDVPEGVKIVAWESRGQAVSVGEGGDLIVGLARPLPQAEIVVLADITFLLRTTDPVVVVIGPRAGAELEGRMAYVQGDDPEIFHPMVGPCGLDTCEAFGFNTGPLAWEEASGSTARRGD